jgi:hypothetical protein
MPKRGGGKLSWAVPHADQSGTEGLTPRRLYQNDPAQKGRPKDALSLARSLGLVGPAGAYSQEAGLGHAILTATVSAQSSDWIDFPLDIGRRNVAAIIAERGTTMTVEKEDDRAQTCADE